MGPKRPQSSNGPLVQWPLMSVSNLEGGGVIGLGGTQVNKKLAQAYCGHFRLFCLALFGLFSPFCGRFQEHLAIFSVSVGPWNTFSMAKQIHSMHSHTCRTTSHPKESHFIGGVVVGQPGRWTGGRVKEKCGASGLLFLPWRGKTSQMAPEKWPITHPRLQNQIPPRPQGLSGTQVSAVDPKPLGGAEGDQC